MPKSAEPTGLVVDQAVFGYADGHQLIESTTKFDADTLAALVRLTDGTGAEAIKAFDGYLSGFPLPDGRYAVSRTFRDHPGSRPGAARTRVLILGRQELSKISSLEELVFALRTPMVDGKLKRVIVSADANPSRISRHSPRWEAVVSALFGREEKPVVVTAGSREEHEAAVVAMWDWMWPALRNDFAFCLGAVGVRRLKPKRQFDLLVVPDTRSSAAHLEDAYLVDPLERTIAGTAIAADMESATESPLRSYVRYCGAESSRRSAVSLITNVWLVAQTKSVDLDARQVAVAETVFREYPSPRSMRRLKASVFAQDSRLPVTWNLPTTLELLAEPSIAYSVLVEDVPLRQLMIESREQPVHLLELAARVSRAPDAHGQANVITVGTTFESIAVDIAIDRMEPTALADVIDINPEASVKVLMSADTPSRNDWAAAFWKLDPRHQDVVSTAYVRLVRSTSKGSGPDASVRTAGWLAYFSPSVESGLNWIQACHTNSASRVNALSDFVHAGLGPRGLDPRWRSSISAAELVGAGTKLAGTGTEDEAQAMLFMLDPGAAIAAGTTVAAWRRVDLDAGRGIEAAHLLRYSRGSAVLTAAETELVGLSFAIVWDALADSNSSVWEALADYPAPPDPGREEWDRAKRVTATIADSVRGWRIGDTGGGSPLVAVVERHSRLASQQLAEVLQSPAKTSPAKKMQGKQVQSRRPSRLESVRDIVDDILSAFRF